MIANDIQWPTLVSGDNQDTTGHGLQHDKTKCLSDRAVKEDISSSIGMGQIFSIKEASEDNMIPDWVKETLDHISSDHNHSNLCYSSIR